MTEMSRSAASSTLKAKHEALPRKKARGECKQATIYALEMKIVDGEAGNCRATARPSRSAGARA